MGKKWEEKMKQLEGEVGSLKRQLEQFCFPFPYNPPLQFLPLTFPKKKKKRERRAKTELQLTNDNLEEKITQMDGIVVEKDSKIIELEQESEMIRNEQEKALTEKDKQIKNLFVQLEKKEGEGEGEVLFSTLFLSFFLSFFLFFFV